jgi:hypothetical protein
MADQGVTESALEIYAGCHEDQQMSHTRGCLLEFNSPAIRRATSSWKAKGKNAQGQ